jgi:hypothetical protein
MHAYLETHVLIKELRPLLKVLYSPAATTVQIKDRSSLISNPCLHS